MDGIPTNIDWIKTRLFHTAFQVFKAQILILSFVVVLFHQQLLDLTTLINFFTAVLGWSSNWKILYPTRYCRCFRVEDFVDCVYAQPFKSTLNNLFRREYSEKKLCNRDLNWQVHYLWFLKHKLNVLCESKHLVRYAVKSIILDEV